ncbi:hypothetical protein RAB80_005230 [Fusarium oxysporum f. sp. vasinfectum]|nr:hypothetical protein RAB80_005230 [Fusarium oxysporum f. sp. vasinfectum]KAK2701195.1 hypothetical protein QWA68_000446 [Fusarium oxysporum]KAK2935429.1 hypothetical protein FoTM2_003371 [Fusarium oxysporum f. sp. vasinfectum]
MISCPPHKHCPKPRFKLTRYIIEKNLALLDPEDFLSQALRYYQNYLQHKELRKHEVLLHYEINTRLDDDMNEFLTKNNWLRYTAGNWLEELSGTSGEQAMESSSTDDHGSGKQLTTEIEMTTGMEIDLPESETYQTSFVEMPSEARSEPQDPTQAARKRRLGDDYDPGESSRQG